MPLPAPVAETYHSSQGGHFVKTFSAVAPATATVYPVTEWSTGKRARLADTTTSASAGERRQKILGGASVRLNVPWNSDNTPEILGLGAGDELDDVTLLFGDSGFHYPPFTMIVESVDIVCGTNDVIRATISGYSQGELGDPVAPT